MISIYTVTTEESDLVEVEAEEFDAQIHIQKFRDVFEINRINYDNWVICQIVHYTTVNRRIANNLSISHIQFLSHNFDLEVERTVENGSELSFIINSVKKL